MKLKTLLITLTVGLVVLVVSYFSFQKLRVKTNSSGLSESIPSNQTENTQNLSDTGVLYTLPSGDHTYNSSHGEDVTGPKMSSITFSPLAFEKNQNQKIKIVFPEKEVVGSVVLFITTDNKENQKVTLTKDQVNNVWQGEWTTDDSIKKRYSAKIVAVGASGEYSNVMYFL